MFPPYIRGCSLGALSATEGAHVQPLIERNGPNRTHLCLGYLQGNRLSTGVFLGISVAFQNGSSLSSAAVSEPRLSFCLLGHSRTRWPYPSSSWFSSILVRRTAASVHSRAASENLVHTNPPHVGIATISSLERMTESLQIYLSPATLRSFFFLGGGDELEGFLDVHINGEHQIRGGRLVAKRFRVIHQETKVMCENICI